MSSDILWALVGLGIGAAIVWLSIRQKKAGNTEQFLALHQAISDRLDAVTAQLDERLRENVHAMNDQKLFLADRVSTTERTVREVSASLGKLEQATTALQRTNEEISSFQKMLTSPKIRGSFGEVLLSNLLAEVIPQGHYELQYHFQNSGEIADAIIRLQDGYIVAVDAKFPLANYKTYIQEQDSLHHHQAQSAFIRDIKKHISDIARKYIAPREHTLDYAFMYIPIEGVYYETMVHDPQGESLWEFCLHHKVIPVSPNSLLSYLHTVLIGLRGMKIEQRTKEILQALLQVRRDFEKFAKDFTMIGTHLSNAKNRHDDAARQLDRFAHRLEQLEVGTETPKLEASTPQEHSDV